MITDCMDESGSSVAGYEEKLNIPSVNLTSSILDHHPKDQRVYLIAEFATCALNGEVLDEEDREVLKEFPTLIKMYDLLFQLHDPKKVIRKIHFSFGPNATVESVAAEIIKWYTEESEVIRSPLDMRDLDWREYRMSKEIIYFLEDLQRDLHYGVLINHLETGFRHTPLTKDEKIQRYEEFLSFLKEDVDNLLENL